MLSKVFQDQVPRRHSYWDGKGTRQEERQHVRCGKRIRREEYQGSRTKLEASSHGVKAAVKVWRVRTEDWSLHSVN